MAHSKLEVALHVASVAEGIFFHPVTNEPCDPARTYTTTWFDMWRFKDGKADEHWDPATLMPAKP